MVHRILEPSCLEWGLAPRQLRKELPGSTRVALATLTRPQL